MGGKGQIHFPLLFFSKAFNKIHEILKLYSSIAFKSEIGVGINRRKPIFRSEKRKRRYRGLGIYHLKNVFGALLISDPRDMINPRNNYFSIYFIYLQVFNFSREKLMKENSV